MWKSSARKKALSYRGRKVMCWMFYVFFWYKKNYANLKRCDVWVIRELHSNERNPLFLGNHCISCENFYRAILFSTMDGYIDSSIVHIALTNSKCTKNLRFVHHEPAIFNTMTTWACKIATKFNAAIQRRTLEFPTLSKRDLYCSDLLHYTLFSEATGLYILC